jgi:hypothetical protein
VTVLVPHSSCLLSSLQSGLIGERMLLAYGALPEGAGQTASAAESPNTLSQLLALRHQLHICCCYVPVCS